MIFILSEKQFTDKKNTKMLVGSKDYIIINATNDDDTKLHRYSNTKEMDMLNPPSKCFPGSKESEKHFPTTSDKRKRAFKKFRNSQEFILAVMAVTATFVEMDGEINIFVVFRNRVYKNYAEKLKDAMEGIIIDDDSKDVKKKKKKESDLDVFDYDFDVYLDDNKDKKKSKGMKTIFYTYGDIKDDKDLLLKSVKKKQVKKIKSRLSDLEKQMRKSKK